MYNFDLMLQAHSGEPADGDCDVRPQSLEGHLGTNGHETQVGTDLNNCIVAIIERWFNATTRLGAYYIVIGTETLILKYIYFFRYGINNWSWYCLGVIGIGIPDWCVIGIDIL